MSLDSDPEIEAAFGSAPTPTSAAPISDDPEIHAAFAEDKSSKKDAKKGEGTEGPLGFINGVAGLAGKGILNVPYMAASGVQDLYRRATGGDTKAPDSGLVDALHVPLNENEKNVSGAIGTQLAPLKDAAETAVAENFPQGERDFASQYVAPVAKDVASILPLANAGRNAVSAVSELGEAPVLPKTVPAKAQDVVNAVSSRQSGGAAGASANIADASLPLQSRISEVDPANVNRTAMDNHLEADRNGIQLMKGQATRDPIQFSEEQNQSTHPIIAKRLNEQNEQMTDRLDEIRREASPTNVSNSARENGQVAVDELKAYDEPIRADIKAKYQRLADANGGAIPIDTGTTIAGVDSRLKRGSLTRTAANDPAVSEVMDNLRSGQPMDFESFESARSLLAGVQRKGGSAGTAAGIVRDELEKMPLPPQAAPLKVMADDARQAAAARFDALKRDPAYEAAVDDVTNGNPKGKPSPLADTFLDDYALSRSAPKSQLDLMMGKLGEEGKGAVASHTLNAIRSGAIGKTGSVLPSGYNGALSKYGDKLDSLLSPETKDSVESLGRVITNAKVAPPGSSVAPKSGVIVRDAIQGAAEHAVNAKTMGAYGFIKKALTKDSFAKEATAPGAGIER